MQVEKMMYDHIDNIKRIIIDEQIEAGHLLGERFFSICDKFRGFNHPSFNIDENKALLNDLLEFEKHICSLEFLYAFYGYIARMYLQTGDAEKAIMYGQAALELNTKISDIEGIRAANNVLCDCAIANDAALIGAQYFKRANPHFTEELKFYETLPNHNAPYISKLLSRKRRPSTFKYFDSEDCQREEETIRFMMMAQGYTRATAKKYVKEFSMRGD